MAAVEKEESAVEAIGACGNRGTGSCSVYIAPQKERRRRIVRPKLQPREGSDGGAPRAASSMVEVAMGGPLAGKRRRQSFLLEQDGEARRIGRWPGGQRRWWSIGREAATAVELPCSGGREDEQGCGEVGR